MKRFKETAIGIAFIVAIVLLYVGISFLKGRNLFSNKETYFVRYNDVTGLSDASPIFAHGVRIGIVDNIFYNPKQPDDIIVRILVDKRLQIPQGSTAVLETELLGSVNVNLQLASHDSPPLSPGDTLEGSINKGIMAEVVNVLPSVKYLVNKVDTLLTTTQSLLTDSSVTNILNNTEEFTSQAGTKLNELSKLFNELSTTVQTYNRAGEHLDTLSGQLSEVAQSIREEEWMARLSHVVNNLDSISSLLVNDRGTAGKIMTDPHLYNSLDATCSEARELIEDIHQNPGRYIRIFGKSKQ